MSKKHPHAQRKKVSTARITPKGAIKKRVDASIDAHDDMREHRPRAGNPPAEGRMDPPPGMPPPWRPRSVKLRNRAR